MPNGQIQQIEISPTSSFAFFLWISEWPVPTSLSHRLKPDMKAHLRGPRVAAQPSASGGFKIFENVATKACNLVLQARFFLKPLSYVVPCGGALQKSHSTWTVSLK